MRQHQSMVFSLAYRFLRNRAVAEELTQDVFLNLHQNIHRLESPSHVTFWLRRVTSNRCIDESRRRKLRPRFSLEEVPEPVALSRPGDPMLSARLQRLVASLPEKAKLVVLLRFQEDLDPSEIAAVLEMPVSTVKSHLHRSLAILKGKLERSRTEVSI
ncbi:MAG: sigma-70 family RNA polymerase sigma factor [Acidobacteriota bacterium]|nr:sigma-70 family RNA polymerase sigma factor [Acidobacteriota bacterium]